MGYWDCWLCVVRYWPPASDVETEVVVTTASGAVRDDMNGVRSDDWEFVRRGASVVGPTPVSDPADPAELVLLLAPRLLLELRRCERMSSGDAGSRRSGIGVPLDAWASTPAREEEAVDVIVVGDMGREVRLRAMSIP